MSISKKTFVIDTNILLHDSQSLLKFKDNDVIIPLMVLEELDALKRNTNEIGRNARDVIRFIDSLKIKKISEFSSGVQLKEGPRVKIHFDSKKQGIEGFPLSLDTNSNKILSVAYLLNKKLDNVIFVSKDFVSRVKAEAMGINAEDYENLKVSFQGIYKGYKKLEVSKREIDLFYKDGSVKLSNNFFANEYGILKSEANSSAIGKFNSSKGELEPLIPISKKGIWGIHPLNVEQKCVMDLLLREDIRLVSLLGPAGTGKTLLALACGMLKVFDEGVYSRILVSRPIMPLGKDIGFLPGTKEEKLSHWMQPIKDNLEFLCSTSNAEANAKDALNWILESRKIEMEAVTYIRGRSLPKIYMIIDEAQNLTPHEIKTIISRAGRGTKVVLTGDPTQIDNPYLDRDTNGLSYTVSRFKNQKIFGHVSLEKTERSKLAEIAAKVM
jgi:PhoH-like ATPase